MPVPLRPQRLELVSYYHVVIQTQETLRAPAYTREFTTDKHPFKMREDIRAEQPPKTSVLILFWKEITLEEYQLFGELST